VRTAEVSGAAVDVELVEPLEFLRVLLDEVVPLRDALE
jgi:hypothetical protein